MEVLLVIAVAAVVLLMIAAPFARGRYEEQAVHRSAEQAELEAAKEAKYRDIREAELDYHTGKLAREDWKALDATLRAEAIELLRRLDALEGRRADADQ